MTLLFSLAPGWAIGADDRQWILLRRRKRQDEAYWQSISYVASTKAILLRILRDKGIQLTSDALVNIGALPDQFGDYRLPNSDIPKTKQPLAATNDCFNFKTPTSLKENAHG
jgi:hypothetical protein